jgi:hypothetical protein
MPAACGARHRSQQRQPQAIGGLGSLARPPANSGPAAQLYDVNFTELRTSAEASNVRGKRSTGSSWVGASTACEYQLRQNSNRSRAAIPGVERFALVTRHAAAQRSLSQREADRRGLRYEVQFRPERRLRLTIGVRKVTDR